ncbi:DUF6187 family protein [Actinokineospora fastidiosa]|uniref:Uncharacterized protein n=1 Tax=Actinokineospora fastidiosa TaxID=1816 RepID=A0A918LCK2_9PSEU|nr:DUF6187 family protein [Actinokineospora fastidiosa]GGS31655.1 hypothetical protein GCM10010171_26930 [Actinokineospora fastidiosa]
MTETRVAEQTDLRFAMPAVDDPVDTEVGIILLGLDADRLLAGLGMTSLADDPGRVAVTVDRMRHGRPGLDADGLVRAGAGYWRAIRPSIAAAYPEPAASASVRQSWNRAYRALDTPALGPIGLATRVYLTACWLRRADVDALA